jgi:predicted DCC family thiol-disulfide oxidoreductase YuxK
MSNAAVEDASAIAEAAIYPELENRLLVVYDGECGFCNRSIRWMLRRDRKNRLRFAPSSSPAAAQLLASHGVHAFGENPGPDTILVFRNTGTPLETLLVRSNALLACLKVLPQPWPIVAAIARLIPRPVRESAYRLIARWRYRIWGRHAICPIPTSEERRHFL